MKVSLHHPRTSGATGAPLFGWRVTLTSLILQFGSSVEHTWAQPFLRQRRQCPTTRFDTWCSETSRAGRHQVVTEFVVLVEEIPRLKEIMWGWMEVNAPEILAWFVRGEQCLYPRRDVRVGLISIDP